jgi:transposase-like protein
MSMTARAPGTPLAPKVRARPHLSPAEARTLLAELARSGESIRGFARRKGLSAHCIAYWRKQLAPPPTAVPPPRFVPVVVPPAAVPAPPPAAVPAAVPPPPAGAASTGFEIALAAGQALRVPAAFDAGALARLVATLREVGAW